MTGGLKKRVAILISGRGSNMAALLAAAADPDFPVEIVAVIANKRDARGLDTATKAGIETRVVAADEFPGKEAQDAALDSALNELGVEIVCLAGFMRLLSEGFVRKWEGRMINIHPSLLPLFRGLDSHRKALEAGLRIHGCTVHFVTPEMDEGPIIAQAAVPVMPDDSEDSLARRVLEAEHRLYPLALRLVASGKARMSDGKAVLTGISAEGSLMSPSSATDEIDIESLARMTP